MATETNALATYDEIISLGVSVKGNYEPNQMVQIMKICSLIQKTM
jgi:hypothetical protein